MLASAVDAVVRARSAWRERLRAAVESWALPAVAVAVFGSSATGTAGERSDIDLLVVRPEGTETDDELWSTQVAEVAQAWTTWTGNQVDVVDSTAGELAANGRLVAEVRAHGDVLTGDLPESTTSANR
ncbi:MAG TPA: nucleotidyltransferase domain-containing protein [Acidimicrobiales bacterium]